MDSTLSTVAYLGATILFILSLGGLSHPETSRRGNLFGMVGMAIAVLATLLGPQVAPKGIAWIVGAMAVGGMVGLYATRVVKMTQMPELVALMHSLVGLAAMLVGFANYIDPAATAHFKGAERTIHQAEIYLGVLIGAVTFSGSVIAFGKLSAKISGKPVLLPGRHWINLAGLVIVIWLCARFVAATTVTSGMLPLVIMTAIALAFGVHMVMAIGGADMPVVVSMLNSYSGWAAAATGFMLSNDLLIVTGALVGSSGAILSYIMCKAMNRSFISVILGGFGGETAGPAAGAEQRTVKLGSAEDAAFLMKNSGKVIIVPGYGMAVAQAQHALREMGDLLKKEGVSVKYAIHPVAGRMPGHMNVLLAEADVPYDKLKEMDDINGEFARTDVALVIGANDVTNPAARSVA
ncbi:MAG: NAD(P)(+) transhydrogenase (Re/Si-specific) subunit beta, partial [Panacagrimonas sp.]